jgi:hypothetical protein
MGTLVEDYSGIAVDQNAPSTAFYPWRATGGNFLYQYFTLPQNFGRGSVDPQFPDLSGFQILVAVDEGQSATASVVARLDYNAGNGWVNVATGTATGAPNDGPYVWFNVLLSSSVPVTAAIAGSQLRFGISLPPDQSISTISYVSPAVALGTATPGSATATMLNGTPLLGADTTASLNFRILALQADSGTDILGNSYRSLVTTAANANVQTTAGAIPVSGAGQAPYWMSQVLPSPTAVESLYFVQDQTDFSLVNLIEDPSFEYDQIGALPEPAEGYWTVTGTVAVSAEWAASGLQSLNMSAASTITSPLGPLPAITNGNPTPLAFSASVNNGSSGAVTLSVQFADANDNPIGSPVALGSIFAAGIQVAGGTTTAPANTAQIQYIIESTGQAYVDAIQATMTSTINGYFDGDSSNCAWLGTYGDSLSAQLVALEPTDNSVVIDSVLLDPTTPGMNFNVYYTNDDSYTGSTMSQEDWDSKLWNRVQQEYVATGRKQYVFPGPVSAKYMKLEFTNPQAQSYNPGDFQIPVSFQQFPTWVSSYFSINGSLTPQTTQADTVNVQYDALSLAYIPYLADLIQGPAAPTAIPDEIVTNTDEYWSTGLSQPADSTTLSQIDISMTPYQQPVGSALGTADIVSTLANVLASSVSAISQNTGLSITESDPNDVPTISLSGVSSSHRDSVLAEQTAPDMYFYLTCRHAYKKSTATFDYNRGYTFGVNAVAFMRNNYQVTADTPQYIESGGDTQNIALNDFTVTDTGWFTYDSE